MRRLTKLPLPESTPSVVRRCVFWGNTILSAYLLLALTVYVFYLYGVVEDITLAVFFSLSVGFAFDYAHRRFRVAALHEKITGLERRIKELTEKQGA